MSQHIRIFDSLAIQTRAKRFIENDFGKPQRSKESMDAFYEEMKHLWPNLERRSWDSTYNCFGMAFANRRTVVDDSALPTIYQDDGYRAIGRPQATPGDVIIYKNERGRIMHVAVVVEKRIVQREDDDELVVLSQWGLNGEYRHSARDVPEVYGRVSEIWTERKS